MPGKVNIAQPLIGHSPVRRATIEAKIIRKDGTVEDLGVIADSGLPPRGFLQRLKDWLHG